MKKEKLDPKAEATQETEEKTKDIAPVEEATHEQTLKLMSPMQMVIRRFFRHLRIDVARLRVKVATGDAATTAIAYGAVTQSINVLFPLLESIDTLSLPQNADLSVEADFLSDSPELDVMFSFSLRVWHLFSVAFSALGAFLKHQFSKKDKHSPPRAS